MKKLIECVPNFSEGSDLKIISKITDAVRSLGGIKILDTFSGKGTNRTVVTFAGTPEDVIEAAYRGIEAASLHIDMSKQKGVHPRIGATDVCPLVPVAGVDMDETVEYARRLAQRVGNDLKLPVYCYEYAAFDENRRGLENIRAGGYEGLQKKLLLPDWKPDFGLAEWNEKVKRSGAVIIGARNFLIAYNVNLDTDSIETARAIAAEIRESGRRKGELAHAVKDGQRGLPGSQEQRTGWLKNVKAIGWYIKEYGFAQVSMNLTDFNITPVHVAFEEVSKQAAMKGVNVTGSELVGLIPLKALLDAGRYFLKQAGQDKVLNERDTVAIGVKYLRLNSFRPFDADKKIIEYLI